MQTLVPVHFVCDYENAGHEEFYGFSTRAKILTESNFIKPPGHKSLENGTINKTLAFASAVLSPECILQTEN